MDEVEPRARRRVTELIQGMASRQRQERTAATIAVLTEREAKTVAAKDVDQVIVHPKFRP